MNPKYFSQVSEKDLKEGMLIYFVIGSTLVKLAFVDCIDNETYLESANMDIVYKLSEMKYSSMWIRKEVAHAA